MGDSVAGRKSAKRPQFLTVAGRETAAGSLGGPPCPPLYRSRPGKGSFAHSRRLWVRYRKAPSVETLRLPARCSCKRRRRHPPSAHRPAPSDRALATRARNRVRRRWGAPATPGSMGLRPRGTARTTLPRRPTTTSASRRGSVLATLPRMWLSATRQQHSREGSRSARRPKPCSRTQVSPSSSVTSASTARRWRRRSPPANLSIPSSMPGPARRRPRSQRRTATVETLCTRRSRMPRSVGSALRCSATATTCVTVVPRLPPAR